MVEMISEKHGTRRHRSKVERRRIVEETLKEWRGKTGAIHLAESRSYVKVLCVWFGKEIFDKLAIEV